MDQQKISGRQSLLQATWWRRVCWLGLLVSAALHLQVLILMGHFNFNHLDVCWESNTVGCKQSRRLLGCTEENFYLFIDWFIYSFLKYVTREMIAVSLINSPLVWNGSALELVGTTLFSRRLPHPASKTLPDKTPHSTVCTEVQKTEASFLRMLFFAESFSWMYIYMHRLVDWLF